MDSFAIPKRNVNRSFNRLDENFQMLEKEGQPNIAGVDHTPKVDITSSPKSSVNSKEKTQSDDIDHDGSI